MLFTLLLFRLPFEFTLNAFALLPLKLLGDKAQRAKYQITVLTTISQVNVSVNPYILYLYFLVPLMHLILFGCISATNVSLHTNRLRKGFLRLVFFCCEGREFYLFLTLQRMDFLLFLLLHYP